MLVIYPIVLNDNFEEFEKSKVENVIFGFALGFPGASKGVMIKYRANKIKLEQLAQRYADVEEEEEEIYD